MRKLVNLRNQKLIADNKKARYSYFIEEEIECGIVLKGSEVKSMRDGRVNIEQQQLWLINSYVPNYENAKTFTHTERRRRKLLVKKRELSKLIKNKGREGMTLVPLKLYFNETGIAKLLIGVGKGKKNIDKRETEKKRDWNIQKNRLLRNKN